MPYDYLIGRSTRFSAQVSRRCSLFLLFHEEFGDWKQDLRSAYSKSIEGFPRIGLKDTAKVRKAGKPQ